MDSLLSILLFVAFLYLMMKYGCGARIHGGARGHASHDHQKLDTSSRATSPLNKVSHDPVCGMKIEMDQAPASNTFGGDTYYFCSKGCYRQFRERPEYFA